MPDLYFSNGKRLAGAVAAYINTQLATTVLLPRLKLNITHHLATKMYIVLSTKSREILDADALGGSTNLSNSVYLGYIL